MVQHKPPEWNQLHNTVIVHRYAIEPVSLILFKTFLHRPTTKEAAEGWERDRERVREIEVCELQWACPCISTPAARDPLASLWHPVHWGLICLARCLCTLLLLVTFWCHGVTMKWLPSHVAARGGATSGTMRSRGVGAGTQEAPAGRNALTLPPPRLPWNRELVEALLTTSQCLCVPGSSQGLARTRGEERHRHRHSNQEMGAWGVTGGNLYVLPWPLTSTEIKLCLIHGTVGECCDYFWRGLHRSALLSCYFYSHSKEMMHFNCSKRYVIFRLLCTLCVHERRTREIIYCTQF